MSIRIFDRIDSDKIREFTSNHGGCSGKIRVNILNNSREAFTYKTIPKEERDKLRDPSRFNEELFKRDGYKCRYCGIKILSIKFLKRFIKEFEHSSFMKGRKNEDKHGIVHICWPVLDHVTPWSYG